MVRRFSEDDVRRVLTMKDALRAVERAFRDRAAGQAVDTPRARTRSSLGTLHILQGAAPALGVVGFRAFHARPDRRTDFVVLIDATKGGLLAVVDSYWLGVMGAGAATGVATRALARSDSTTLGCIGAGPRMVAQIEAVCAVRPIRSVRVFAPHQDRLGAFCKELGERLGEEIVPAPSVADAVAGADIVNVMTRSSPTPVLLGAALVPGMHVNAAGVNRLDHRELDLEAVRRADLIVVDSVQTARAESGDLLGAVEAGLVHWEGLADLGGVLAGQHPGRQSDEQITLFESHGLALQDLYAAHHVMTASPAAALPPAPPAPPPR